MKKLLLVLIITCIASLAQAQEPNPEEKTSFLDSLNRYYQHVSLPVYLFISSSPDVSDASAISSGGKITPVPMFLDGHGKHSLRHPDSRHGSVNFEIYADGRAPISISSFEGAPKYVKGKEVFFGKGLRVKVKASDEMSGLKGTYISIDGAPFSPYLSSQTFDVEKLWQVKYYSTDRVGNVEKPTLKQFTVDLSPPEMSLSFEGVFIDEIYSPKTKFTLSTQDALSGVSSVQFQIDEGNWQNYVGKVSLSTLSDGMHTIRYRSMDHVKNKSDDFELDIYVDATPPMVSAEPLGDRFVLNGMDFFSGRTKLKLTALDNKSGVASIQYSIDGGPFLKYEEPFYIPNKPGLHVVKYFSVDNVQNKGGGQYERNVSNMYMDLTGPSMNHDFIGPKFVMRDTVFVHSTTKIKLNATDAESGMEEVLFQVDGGSPQSYTEVFEAGSVGFHEVSYEAFDRVNNSNRKSFFYMVDDNGPEIYIHYSISPIGKQIIREETLDIYSKHTVIFLAATDDYVGYKEIMYSLNGGAYRPYSGLIQGFAKGQKYTLKIRAKDRLGNVSEKEETFVIEP